MRNPIIFFGDKSSAINPVTQPGEVSITDQSLKNISIMHGFNTLIFPYQVHGTAGLIIESDNGKTTQSFVHDADWVITNVPGIGIGVLTADCVPLLVHDPVQQAVGAIHAGWRGAVDGVVVAALDGMRSIFGSHAEDLQVYSGPHARLCCYQVDQQLYDTVMQKKYGKSAWRRNEQALFFDLYNCCIEQLQRAGVLHTNIIDMGVCTMCTHHYSSYRREKNAALRNVSIIGMHTF